MTLFSDFPLREELTEALAALGFEQPTPIQEKTIPLLLEQPQDIVGLAQTGTGKTAAFGLPMLQHVDVNNKKVQGLILSPTRELCMQIEAEMQKYGRFIKGLKSVAVYGGVPIGGQMRQLRTQPQIIVATPGRLIDLLERKAIDLDEVQYVTLDEADEMLNMGFRDDIDFILQNTPARKYTWLFSATMSKEVRGIAKRFMSDWKEVSVAAANTTNENIDHQYYVTQRHQRYATLQRLLDFSPGIYGIIFVRTRQDCQDISDSLMKEGYQVSALHGDMDQKARSRVMDRFKNKELQAIVATDVAARGIDVNNITHVINFELPDDPEIYTHRSGRTARAGKSGICMSIVTPREVSQIRNIERLVNQKFTRSDIPDGSEVIRKKLFHFLDEVENAKPQKNFGETYRQMIHDRFEEMEKDELIRRLMWLKLKDAVAANQESEDLNATYEDKSKHVKTGGKTTRLFINLGTKDGMQPGILAKFLTEATDVPGKMIDRITVRDLSSYFNVPNSAAQLMLEVLPNKKFHNRKVRIDLAEEKPGGYSGKGGPKPAPRGGFKGKQKSYKPE